MDTIDDFAYYLYHERNRTENTIDSYKRDLKHFTDFLKKEGLDSCKFQKINQTNIMAYIMYLEKEGKTSATISRNLASLKTFFRYLITKGIVSNDPVFKLKAPKVNRTQPKFIDIGSIELLLDQPDTTVNKGIRDKAILELLYATGIKVTELITLNIFNINLEMKYIECTSSQKKRFIPIGNKAVQALKNYIDNARDNMIKEEKTDILFVNCNGHPFTRQGLWKIIRTYAKKAGLDEITPNILRHSFAMHLVKNGADMESLKEMLGHSDTSTTQIYYQAKKDRLKDVYEKAHPRN